MQSLQPHKNVSSIFLNEINIFFSIKLHVYSYSTHYMKEKVWLHCTNVDLWPSRSRLLARAPQNGNVAAQPRAYLWAGHMAAALTPVTYILASFVPRPFWPGNEATYIRAYHTVGCVGSCEFPYGEVWLPYIRISNRKSVEIRTNPYSWRHLYLWKTN